MNTGLKTGIEILETLRDPHLQNPGSALRQGAAPGQQTIPDRGVAAIDIFQGSG